MLPGILQQLLQLITLGSQKIHCLSLLFVEFFWLKEWLNAQQITSQHLFQRINWIRK